MPIPCPWLDGQAEQAAAHDTATFPRSQVLGVVSRDGDPQFTFSEAMSFQVL